MHDLDVAQEDASATNFEPTIRRMRRLIARWSFSTRLFRYFFDQRILIVSRPTFITLSAAV
jgi:hypothetical protein